MYKLDEKELKQLEDIEKRTDAEVWAEADYYYNRMADFNQAFAPYEQALTEAFGPMLDKDYPNPEAGWQLLSIKERK